MEAAAEALDVEPTYFLEYREFVIRSAMQRFPELTNKLFEVTQEFLASQQEKGEHDERDG